jgi:hypothetical protein
MLVLNSDQDAWDKSAALLAKLFCEAFLSCIYYTDIALLQMRVLWMCRYRIGFV